MTTRQLLNSFSQAFDPTASTLAVQTEVALRWLNAAQIQLVKSRWMQPAPGAYIEQQLQAQEDLAKLRVDDALLDTTYAATVQGFFADRLVLPPDLLLLVNVKANIRHRNGSVLTETFTPGQGRTISGPDVRMEIRGAKRASPDDILDMLKDPFNRPTIINPLYVRSATGLDFLTDSTFVAPAGYVSYIKTPATLSLNPDVDSELPDYLHEELVDVAVGLMRRQANGERSQNPSQ